MAAIEFYLPTRFATHPRRDETGPKPSVERELDAAPRSCSGGSAHLTLCAFGSRDAALQVSVVDCCCDRHAREALRRAEVALRRELAPHMRRTLAPDIRRDLAPEIAETWVNDLAAMSMSS